MEIQKIPAARLNPAAYNPRVDLKPGDKEYEKLKRSINEFGYVEPVIWNRQTGNVVGGHQRLKVLMDLGQTEIDCVVVDLDLAREKALNIALNKIQGDWDEDKLAAIMADFDAEAFDVSLTGFDANEVDALLNRFYSHEAEEDDFDAGAEKKKIQDAGGPVSQPGDAWQLGDHILICGDPADPAVYARLMGSERAQCAITSPPIDPKEYARDGIAPWLKQYAAMLAPVLACELMWSLGENVYAGVYGHVGRQACAAMTLTAPVQSLTIGALCGLSQAAGVLVGKALGRDDSDGAYRISVRLLVYGLIGAAVLSGVILCAAPLYVRLFRVEEEVRAMTRQILTAYALIAPVKVLNMILGSGILRSGGRTELVMWIDLIGTWGFGVPLACLGGFVLHLPIAQLYFLLSMEECVRLTLSIWTMKRRRWMRKLET